MTNDQLARRMLEHARELSRRPENLYRVRAYRRAAMAVQLLPRPVAELLAEGGREVLEAVPGIGRHLAETIELFVRSGEWKTHAEIVQAKRAG